jgi:vitamin B12 transporter
MEVAPPARIPANKVAARKCGLNAQVLSGKTARVFSRVFLFMKFSFSRARLSVLSLACLSAISASAQSDSNHSLGEVVVTASRNPQLLSATSAHTTVITREEIEHSQATDVITLLQREAGLQSAQNGGMGSTSTIFMRGLPSLDTLILIDGVAQNKQDASGVVSLEHIMLDNVERIEVVRGNVSAIYGSGAIGGVIQIFTRAGTKESSAKVGLEVGPRNTAKATTQVSVSVGSTYLSAGLSRLSTDGYSAINTQQYAFANPDADGYQNTSSNLSINHAFFPEHRMGLQLTQSSGNSKNDSNFNVSIPTDVHASTAKLSQTTLYSDDKFGSWHSRINVSEQSERDTFSMAGSYNALYGYDMRTQILSWVNTLPIGENWLGTAGVEEQQQHVETNADDGTPPYDINRLADAVFVGMEGCFGPFTVQLNLRNDKLGPFQKDTSYFGLGYAISDVFKLTASTSTAFNAPPLGYLYDPYSGNPLLKPESADSNEIGLQYSMGGNLVRATYFDTRVQDQLLIDFNTYRFTNVSHARNSGVEVSFKGSVGSTDIRASLTQQNPVDEGTGQPLQRRAKTMASMGLSQMLGSLRAGADLRYVGDRNDLDASTSPGLPVMLRGYTVLDLTMAYRYSPQLLLTVRLDNVTDEKYQTVYGYNQQPQSLYAGLTWTPKR